MDPCANVPYLELVAAGVIAAETDAGAFTDGALSSAIVPLKKLGARGGGEHWDTSPMLVAELYEPMCNYSHNLPGVEM